MTIALRRALLGLLGFVGAFTGVWAYAAPRNWFDRFPGFGLHWLPQLGPFNEHLAKDDGAMFLALAVLAGCAVRWAADERLVRVTALVWLVFDVLHLIFHMQHLDMYGTRDQVLNVLFLGLLPVVSLALLAPLTGRRPSSAR
jgi:hypothetical protein